MLDYKSVLQKNQAIELNFRICLYIPSTVNVNKVINNEKYVNETASLFSNLFGGASSYQMSGYWNSEKEGLIKENTVNVYSFTTKEEFEKNFPLIYTYVLNLKEELKQEAISLEIDGTLYLI